MCFMSVGSGEPGCLTCVLDAAVVPSPREPWAPLSLQLGDSAKERGFALCKLAPCCSREIAKELARCSLRRTLWASSKLPNMWVWHIGNWFVGLLTVGFLPVLRRGSRGLCRGVVPWPPVGRFGIAGSRTAPILRNCKRGV